MLGITNGWMVILSSSVLEPLSVLKARVLNNVPLLPARFTVASIWPLVPGASVHGNGGNFAVVQPQDGRTLKMTTGLVERLVKLKTKCAVVRVCGDIGFFRCPVPGEHAVRQRPRRLRQIGNINRRGGHGGIG